MADPAADSGEMVVGKVKVEKASAEFKMSALGLDCPDQFVNDFTPQDFEEIAAMFKRYDKDDEGGVDLHELRALLEELELDCSEEEANELMAELDGASVRRRRRRRPPPPPSTRARAAVTSHRPPCPH